MNQFSVIELNNSREGNRLQEALGFNTSPVYLQGFYVDLRKYFVKKNLSAQAERLLIKMAATGFYPDENRYSRPPRRIAQYHRPPAAGLTTLFGMGRGELNSLI